MSAFPGIQSGYDYGNELLGDKQLSAEEKNEIDQDMDSHGQEFQILQKDINDEQDRSEMVPIMSFNVKFLALTQLASNAAVIKICGGSLCDHCSSLEQLSHAF